MDQNYSVSSRPARGHKSSSGSRGIVLLIALLVIGGGGFAGGMQYEKNHGTSTGRLSSNTTVAGQMGANSQGGKTGGPNQNGSIGTVTAISATSISLKNIQISSIKTYSITSSTAITNNGTSETYSDIVVGDKVMVSTSSSSSTIATQIMINPTMGSGQSSPGGVSTNGSTSN